MQQVLALNVGSHWPYLVLIVDLGDIPNLLTSGPFLDWSGDHARDDPVCCHVRCRVSLVLGITDVWGRIPMGVVELPSILYTRD